MIRLLLFLVLGAAAMPAAAQMTVTTNMTPAQLVQNVLTGAGVTVSNITYNGAPMPATPQDGSGSFTAAAGSFGISQGLILTSGLASSIPGIEMGINSDMLGTGGDPDLLSIISQANPGGSSNDKAVLEFDFIPSGDSVRFNYVFASEEYPDFNCSPAYNDVFGFFISGPGITGPYSNNAMNIALVPGTTLPVSIANIHGSDGFACPAANAQYYVSNTNGTTVIFGGYTTVLTAEAAVTCGATYHIKLAICDAGDTGYDSAVFLQAGSFQSTSLPTVTAATLSGDATAAEGCDGGRYTVHRPQGQSADSAYTFDFFFTGTATAGTDFTSIAGPVSIPPGQSSVDLPIQVFDDGITEGVETAIMNIFLVNACGDTVTASAMLALIDYTPMEIQTETALLLTCDQDSIPLNATVTGGFGQVTLAWGDTLNSNTVYVPGMENGTYTVVASDECPKQVMVDVVVDAGCEVIIPNVITPNGDGMNDRFVVEGIKGRENRVRIWDRWGKEVLNVGNYQNTFNATGLSDGVYFYVIDVMEKTYTGHLQVLANGRKP